MIKKIIFFSAIVVQLHFLYAGGMVGGSTEITQLWNNIQLQSDTAANIGSFSNSVASKIKDYSLDPVASQIANNLINRAVNDTYNWMKSGFPGDGPAFIINPDAYYKNIANEQIRIQLDSINKSNNPNKSAIAVALIKNIRAERAGVGSKIESTLFDTLQKETCTPENLDRIARDQIAGGLSTTDSKLSEKDQLIQLKSKLNSEFCTSSTKNNPEAQAKLQNCMQAGGCGEWGTIFAMFQPENTVSGSFATARDETTKKTVEAIATQKTKVSNGLIPNETCKQHLEVDDEGNRYPDGEGPCVEWNTTAPVQYTIDKFTQAVTQQYGKLSNVHSFGDLLGDVASNFLQNQVEKALYSGLSKTLTSNKKTNSINISYDNLVTLDSRALPDNLLPNTTTNGGTSSSNVTVLVAKAQEYCDNPGDKKTILNQPCKHLLSNKKTKEVDTLYDQAMTEYTSTLNELKTCSQETGANQKFSTLYSDRKNQYDQSGHDEIQGNILLYPSSVSKLAQTIISVYEKPLSESTDILLDFATYSADSSAVIPLGQEKMDSAKYTIIKRTVNNDIEKLRSDITECQNSLCTDRFRGGCPTSNSSNDPSPGL